MQQFVILFEKNRRTNQCKNCKYILKVTGKYYLENVLEDCDKTKDMFLQKHRKSDYQNSEYFGMSKNIFEDFIENNEISATKSMEKYLYEYSGKNGNWTTIGYFPNNVKRADGSLVKEL